MTLEEITQKIQQIEDAKHDDETAHSLEDDLHQAVLKSIANKTCPTPRTAAWLALTTLKIDFERWCA